MMMNDYIYKAATYVPTLSLKALLGSPFGFVMFSVWRSKQRKHGSGIDLKLPRRLMRADILVSLFLIP